MKVSQIKGFECPECAEFIALASVPVKGQEDIRYECGECEELYEDREEAVACCKE